MPSRMFLHFSNRARTLFLIGEAHEGVRFLTRGSSCTPKHQYKILSPKTFPQNCTRVEISNKVILAFDRPKAKYLKPRASRVQHPSTSSTKYFKRNEAPKQLGAKQKSRKCKLYHFGRKEAPKMLGAKKNRGSVN
jgi:hypothetical protein